MKTYTGGCVCGAVRYQFTLKPLAMFKCHCRTCQKVTGGAYTPVVLVSAKSFKITQGALQHHFTHTIEGGRHKRGFCHDCGSRITGAEKDDPGRWLAVTASSLDDPSIFKADSEIFTSHAQAWDLLDPDLPHHPLYPPA